MPNRLTARRATQQKNAHLRTVLLAGILTLGTLLTAQAQEGQDESSLPSIPDYVQQNGLSGMHGYDRQTAHETINTFNGKLNYRFVDLHIPGNGGMDLLVQRSYNSIDDPLATPALWMQHEHSPVGLGWTLHMGRVIRGAGKGICSASWAFASANPVLELPDGSRHILYEQSGQPSLTWMSKDFWRAQCHGGYLHVQSPDGTTYEMTTPGHLFGEPGSKQKAWYAGRITDRNGNWFKLSYQFLSNGILALGGITTSDGRAVGFSYNGSTLASITDTQTGRVWQYTLGSGPGGHVYLNKVQRPDGLAWQYTYHQQTPGAGSLHSVQYPEGGSIAYTYSHVNFKAGTPRSAQSTVVASKTASTNTADGQTGTWSWAYAPATQALPHTQEDNGGVTYHYNVPPPVLSQVNVTTATDPLGQVTQHFHLGLRSVPQAPQYVGAYIGSSSDAEHVALGYRRFILSTQQDVVAHWFTAGYYYPQALVQAYQRHSRAGEIFETTQSGFDNWGNPSTIVETGGNGNQTHTRTRSLGWSVNTSKWLLRQVSSETVTVGSQTHATTRQFDGNGNVLSQTSAGVPQTFTWHGSGDLRTRSNALGQSTTYTQYHRGIAQNEMQPGGVKITRSVDHVGNVTKQTNGNGNNTQYTYDSLGRVTSITRPAGNPISVTWTANARSVQRGAMTDATTFDGLGRPLRRVISAAGEVPIALDFQHDMLGRRVFQSWPNSSKGTGFRYDALGRVVQTLHGNTPGSDSADLLESTDHYSLQILRQDSTGRASMAFFRAFGNPDERHVLRTVAGELDGGSIYVEYDAHMARDLLGQLTSVTLGGKTRSYGYDSRYFLTSRTDPETGTTLFGRDAIGNMLSQSTNGQSATTYGYDSRNRLASVTYPLSEDGNVPKAEDVQYSYDHNDLLTSIVKGSVQRHFAYDAGDKLVQEQWKIGNATYSASYGFSANEALASITYPSGHQVQYNPDALGRARAALPHVTQVTYHPNGMPGEIRYANGAITTMQLNERQWPSGLKTARSGNSFINSEYAYDPVGNLVEIYDSADMQYSRLYAYDTVNRLRVEGSTQGWRDFFYDGTGNLTHIHHPYGWQVHSYGPGSGLLAAVSSAAIGKTYTYDSAGNVTGDGTLTFGYDRANTMRCMQCGTPAPVWHTYDGNNMRVQTLENGSTTQYLHGHQGLLLQTLTPGAQRKEHIYLGRRQIALRRVALD